MRRSWRIRTSRLTYEMERNVRGATATADMIRQATANLISNAVRYTPAGGHYHGAACVAGDIMAAIQVRGHGHRPVRPTNAKMVFYALLARRRGPHARERRVGHRTLAVVKEIVDRHQWLGAGGGVRRA